jgi:O-antigen/teichoic acid export membrane protein
MIHAAGCLYARTNATEKRFVLRSKCAKPISSIKYLGKMLSHPRLKKYVLNAVFLAEQVFFSGANFLLMIVLTRFYSEVEVSAYGIGLSVSLVMQGLLRNCYMVQNSVLPPAIVRNRAAKVMGQHLIIWLTIAIVESVLLIALLEDGTDARAVSIMAATLTTTLIYGHLSFDRIMMIKHEKYLSPMIAAGIFAALITALFALNWQGYGISFFTAMMLLSLFAAAKILYSVIALARPDFLWGWRLAKKNLRKYFFSSTMGSLGYTGYNHIPLFILGLLPSQVPAAIFTAMRGLTQPLQMLIRSIDIVDKNFFQTKAMMTERDVRDKLFRQTALYGVFGSVFIVLVVLFGEPLIHLAYGEKYSGAGPVLTAFSLWALLLTISFPLETVIVRKGRLNRYNNTRLIAGAAGTAFALYLCPAYGALGGIWSCIIGSVVSTGLTVWLLRDVMFLKTEINTNE